MPNRFVDTWSTFRTVERPDGSPGPTTREGTFVMRHISDTQVGVTFIPLAGKAEPEFPVTTTNPSGTNPPNPPFITFSRTESGSGRAITYAGWIVKERAVKSKIAGIYEINTLVGAGSRPPDETGDWTANRPPPRPRKITKSGGAKKASAAKKSPAKKAAKSQKSATSKKGSAAKKTARASKSRK